MMLGAEESVFHKQSATHGAKRVHERQKMPYFELFVTLVYTFFHSKKRAEHRPTRLKAENALPAGPPASRPSLAG